MTASRAGRLARAVSAALLLMTPVSLAPDTRAAIVAQSPLELYVVIETPDASRQLGRVMQILINAGLLPSDAVVTHEIRPGDSVSAILRESYRIPGVTTELKTAINAMNPQLPRGIDHVLAGDVLMMPAALDTLETKAFVRGDETVGYPTSLRRGIAAQLDDDGATQVVPIRGYILRIPVPDRGLGLEVAERIYNLRVDGVAARVRDGEGDRLQLPRYVSPTAYYEDCSTRGATGEADYAELLPSMQSIELPRACFIASNWPHVFMIDQPIFGHKELKLASAGTENDENSFAFRHSFRSAAAKRWLARAANPALDLSGRPITPVDDGAHRCLTRDFAEDTDHGTYLAGLLSSAADGTGLKSIIPGLTINAAPNTREDGMPGSLDEAGYHFLLNEISLNYEERGDRIMVIASPFPRDRDVEAGDGPLWITYQPFHLDGLRLKDPERRFENLPAKIVRSDSQDTIWIISAGQDERGNPEPLLLDATTPQAPQNLGTLSNVVVVTACEDDCGEATRRATLWANSNRPRDSADHVVTIAAPGTRVPGIVMGGRYSITNGTSPAAAYVASVTAAMYACSAPFYDQPDRLKRNLVLSSSPFLFETVETPQGTRERVSHVTVINPRLALKDPNSNWILMGPGGSQLHDLRTDPEPIEVDGWCVDRIPFFDEEIDVQAIRRLTRVADGKWVAFTRSDDWALGDKMFYPQGPLDLRMMSDMAPLFKANDELVLLGNVRDILLKRTYSRVAC